MKCALWLALVVVVTLSVLPKRTEAKQLLSDDNIRPTYPVGEDDHTDEDENVGEENFDGNSDSDVDETEKENEGDKKDDKDDDGDEESENVRKVDENHRERGIGNRRNNSEDDKANEDNTKEIDENSHSEDSKSDELLGDEGDDKEQEMSLDLLLGERDYINDNFLAKEGYQYNEDGLYDDVQEEDVFSKDENEPKNEEDFHHEDEDYYDNEEEVDEEEWTGMNLRNNNQNDLEEEEEYDRLLELKDRNLGTVSDREGSYFGTSNSTIIGVVLGAVFLAGLLIGLVIMIITYRLLTKSRGFVRLSKHDEFSSQTPIYKKTSGPKCDIVSV